MRSLVKVKFLGIRVVFWKDFRIFFITFVHMLILLFLFWFVFVFFTKIFFLTNHEWFPDYWNSDRTCGTLRRLWITLKFSMVLSYIFIFQSVIFLHSKFLTSSTDTIKDCIYFVLFKIVYTVKNVFQFSKWISHHELTVSDNVTTTELLTTPKDVIHEIITNLFYLNWFQVFKHLMFHTYVRNSHLAVELVFVYAYSVLLTRAWFCNTIYSNHVCMRWRI